MDPFTLALWLGLWWWITKRRLERDVLDEGAQECESDRRTP